jgi:KaiC/GvpD/RAD55 family RecA-like ATPase
MFATEQECPPPPEDATVTETPDDPRTRVNGSGGDGHRSATCEPKRFTTFADVIRRWRGEGRIVRVPSGIPTLDQLCGGGLPIPRRILVVGAPGAAKTYFESRLLRRFAVELSEHGCVVGIHAVDEDDGDLTIRFAQMAGFLQAQIEERDQATLDQIDAALRDHPIRFYGYDWTIEEVAQDVAAWAKAEGKHGAMGTDSLHTVTSQRAAGAQSEREYVTANISALRWAYDHLHLTTLAVAEMNRAGYSNAKTAAEANPLASAAEARACEYWAQLLLALQSVKDCHNVVHAVVAKNRGSKRGEFWFELDHPTHGLREVPDPEASPEAKAEKKEQTRIAAQAEVAERAKVLAGIVHRSPGIGERDLRAKIASKGLKWGRDKLEAAKAYLLEGAHGVRLVDRTPDKRDRSWYVEPLAAERGGSDA